MALHHPEWIKADHLTLGRLEDARHKIRKRIYVLKSLLIDAENDAEEIGLKLHHHNQIPRDDEIRIAAQYIEQKSLLDKEMWDARKPAKKGFDKVIEGLLDL